MLDSLFYPSSVAVIGASRDARKPGGGFVRTLLRFDFQGRLYPINPTASEIMGLKAYPSVLDVPERVDLAIVAIPAPSVPKAIDDCAEKGVGFAVIHSVGLGEVGLEGKDLESKVLQAAKTGGVRIVGPNCMGICCPEAGINTIVSSADVSSEGGSVAFVGQSGWATESLLIAGSERGLQFSKVISSGNQIDLSLSDYLEYLASDAKTKVIAAYTEGLRDGGDFLELARAISKKKPLIVWKAGKSQAGARAVASHTASLAGRDAIWSTAFKQVGAIRAQHLDELIDFLVAFGCPYLPKGNRVGILTEAGGGGAVAADACEDLGLEVPALAEETQRELRELLQGIIPPFAGVSNPVDLVWITDPSLHVLERCATIMSRAVDALLIMTYYPLADESIAADMEKLQRNIGKPVAIVPAYPTKQYRGLGVYARHGLIACPTLDRAARAFSILVDYNKTLQNDLSG